MGRSEKSCEGCLTGSQGRLTAGVVHDSPACPILSPGQAHHGILAIRRCRIFTNCCTLALSVVSLSVLHAQSTSLGIFDGQSDVGAVTPPGAAVYNPATGAYTLTSAGANLWGTTDAFHFLWKKASGDISLTADIDFPDTTSEHSPHRKAILIVRQTLDADSAYADAADHGSGEAALQDRRVAGGITEGIELDSAAPRRLRLEKRGDTFTLYLPRPPTPPSTR